MASTTPTNSASPSASATANPTPADLVHTDLNPIVSFIIGFGIVLAASIMNAGGLNLVKLDMVRTMALPKAQRRRDFLRPLWLIGMILYISSQLIGSTLALEFLRAEYVAPLGSSSLIFNFLFARLLVGTPVTRNDILGAAVVVLGVVGVVAFGSINKGLLNNMDLNILISLWSRAGWISYFVIMGVVPIFILYIGASHLESILFSRQDLIDDPITPKPTSSRTAGPSGLWATTKAKWEHWMHWTRDKIEGWSIDKSDKTLAWTLGICWACCGGALAGGTLVFAKATVKLVSGSLSNQNSGNQFAHPATIFTLIFLVTTAVLQILCLNRGLRAYDSTLVVPVFYGVYTASGFLDSLIFNDEVDSYQTWTLFLIFASILVLIAGVVLLTLKKPEPKKPAASVGVSSSGRTSRGFSRNTPKPEEEYEDEGDEISLAERGSRPGHSKALSWEVGDDSEDDDIDHTKPPVSIATEAETSQRRTLPDNSIEARGLMSRGGEGDDNDFGEFASPVHSK